MTKSLEELSEKLRDLRELRENAEATGSPAAAQQVLNGAMELLSTGKEFAPAYGNR